MYIYMIIYTISFIYVYSAKPDFFAPNISVNKLSPICTISCGFSLKSSHIILNIDKDGFATRSSFDKYNFIKKSKMPRLFKYLL